MTVSVGRRARRVRDGVRDGAVLDEDLTERWVGYEVRLWASRPGYRPTAVGMKYVAEVPGLAALEVVAIYRCGPLLADLTVTARPRATPGLRVAAGWYELDTSPGATRRGRARRPAPDRR